MEIATSWGKFVKHLYRFLQLNWINWIYAINVEFSVLTRGKNQLQTSQALRVMILNLYFRHGKCIIFLDVPKICQSCFSFFFFLLSVVWEASHCFQPNRGVTSVLASDLTLLRMRIWIWAAVKVFLLKSEQISSLQTSTTQHLQVHVVGTKAGGRNASLLPFSLCNTSSLLFCREGPNPTGIQSVLSFPLVDRKRLKK